MKKLILFLSLCGIARAVGTVQQTTQQIGNTAIYTVSLYWTGDAITGTVPVTLIQAQSIPIVQGYRIVNMEAFSGTPTPTSGYSIALLDTAGVDVLAGAASSVVSASPQGFVGSPSSPPIFGSISLSITGQSVAGAKGTVFIYLAPFSQVIGLAPTSPSFPAQGANLVYASPCGASGSPGFRALCATDLTLAGLLGSANTWTANNTYIGAVVDLHGSTKTLPNRSGTGSPNGRDNCATVGESYFQTDAPVGLNLWACTTVGSPGTWTNESVAIPSGTQLQNLRIQPNTGNNTTLQFGNQAFVNAADFNFPAYSCNGGLTCVQGGTSAGSLVIGNNSLTMTPVPLGVNGTDNTHYLYISGGNGTAEGCLINGGAGTAGQASGVIVINCANTHSGAWTLASGTAGIQEELQNAATTNGSAYISPGTYTVNTRIALPPNVSMIGAGPALVNIVVNTSSGANTNEIITTGAGRMEGFTVTLTSAPTMNCIELDSFINSFVEKVNCQNGQDGIRVNLGSGNSYFTDIQVFNQTRNGVFFNADSSGEDRFTRVKINQSSFASGATGFLIQKTTTTDLGGIYLQNCLANQTGTGLSYLSTVASPMPLRIQEGIFDFDTLPVTLQNITNVSIVESWMNASGVSVALTLNTITDFVIAGNTFIGVGSAGINFTGTNSNGSITGNSFGQIGTAFNFVSSPTDSNILFRGNSAPASFTNNLSLMATASAGASYLTDGPVRASQLNQSAAVGVINLIASAPASQYRLSWYAIITQAATTSSGLQVNFAWNDGVAAQTFSSPNLTTNTVGANQTGSIMITNAAAQNLAYSTSYASVGATVMKYSVYITLEML